jgi:hypothetical protein
VNFKTNIAQNKITYFLLLFNLIKTVGPLLTELIHYILLAGKPGMYDSRLHNNNLKETPLKDQCLSE